MLFRSRGFFPLDRCVITRTADAERVENSAAQTNQNASALAQVARAAQAVAAAPSTDFANAITAECTLEWITLQDKRNPPRLVQAGSAAQ